MYNKNYYRLQKPTPSNNYILSPWNGLHLTDVVNSQQKYSLHLQNAATDLTAAMPIVLHVIFWLRNIARVHLAVENGKRSEESLTVIPASWGLQEGRKDSLYSFCIALIFLLRLL